VKSRLSFPVSTAHISFPRLVQAPEHIVTNSKYLYPQPTPRVTTIHPTDMNRCRAYPLLLAGNAVAVAAALLLLLVAVAAEDVRAIQMPSEADWPDFQVRLQLHHPFR